MKMRIMQKFYIVQRILNLTNSPIDFTTIVVYTWLYVYYRTDFPPPSSI